MPVTESIRIEMQARLDGQLRARDKVIVMELESHCSRPKKSLQLSARCGIQKSRRTPGRVNEVQKKPNLEPQQRLEGIE